MEHICFSSDISQVTLGHALLTPKPSSQGHKVQEAHRGMKACMCQAPLLMAKKTAAGWREEPRGSLVLGSANAGKRAEDISKAPQQLSTVQCSRLRHLAPCCQEV